MKIIFDLDHTLFNATLFKNDLFDIFIKNGVSREDVLISYGKYLKEVGGAYNFVEHANILQSMRASFDKEKALEEFEAFNKSDFRKYIASEVFATLDFLKKKGYALILLTKGGLANQTLKIKQSGLNVFFDEVYICQGNKFPSLQEINPQQDDWFVNDHWEETLEIKGAYPKLNYFLLKRNDMDNLPKIADADISVIFSISELLEYVK